MSPVSQTPLTPRRLGAGRRTALLAGLVAAGVLIAVAPSLDGIARLALSGRPHAPDMALLAAMPLAIKLHLAAALAALALGAVLMSTRKGRLFHRTAGWTWVALVSLVAGSSLFITELRPGRLSLLHIFTAVTLIVLPLAVARARRHEAAQHRRAMMGLFYGGFAINLAIAFMPGRILWAAFFG